MASVYQARDPTLERKVAIKVLHPHLAVDPSFAARFRREARAVAALRHPNIVRVFDFDSQDGSYYMVMEFINGPTLTVLLKRQVKQGETLSAREILRIFPALCSAIDYAAERGMVHRDIKPSNVILTKAGEPVLTDYGIARIAGSTSYTAPGSVIGSARYMSPEQAQGLIDPRSDLYSLGVVLFEALTGRVPFDGDTTATILAQHISAPVPSARALNPGLPVSAEAVVARALAKDPGARYQSGAELAEALEASLAPTPVDQPAATPIDQLAATRLETGVPPPTRLEQMVALGETRMEPFPESLGSEAAEPAMARPRRSRRRTWWTVGAAALVLVIAAVVAIVAFAGEGNSPATSTTGDQGTETTSTGSTPASGAVSSTSTSLSASSTSAASDTAALLSQGDSLLQLGRLDDAVAKYQQALQLDSASVAARTKLGIVYLLMPSTTQLAEQELQAAVTADPTNADALAFLGEARFLDAYTRNTGGYSDAEQALQEALSQDQNNALAHGFLGEVYAALGSRSDALSQGLRATELAPDDYWTLSSLGYVHALLGDWSDAVGPYRDSVTRQPNLAFLQLLLAEALRHTGQYDEAMSYAQSALALGQGYEERVYAMMGHTLWLKGDLDGAVIYFQKALSLNDGGHYAQWGLGAVLYRKGDYSTALTHLQRAATLQPKEAQYHSWLGACLVNVKRHKEAKTELEWALQLDPSITEAQDLLKQLKDAGY
jgi:eukaryotic-like serine/threonine-protein kinase